MEWDWPQLPRRVVTFIETGIVEHSVRVDLVSRLDQLAEKPGMFPLKSEEDEPLEWWLKLVLTIFFLAWIVVWARVLWWAIRNFI